jgi:DNA-binding Xre family transcriptional regulator
VQLCREAEMTPTNWYRIEAEEVKVLPLETLRRIEKVLNFSFSVFEDEIF